MRKKTRERLVDFEVDEHGNYVYRGKHVRLSGPLDHRHLLMRLWLAGAVAVVCAVVPGVINPRGLSLCPYVVMPYMLHIVAIVSVVWGLARFSMTGERVRAYVRDETIGSLPGRSVLAAILALICAVGEVVYLVIEGITPAVAEMALIVCELASAAALVALRRIARACTWVDD